MEDNDTERETEEEAEEEAEEEREAEKRTRYPATRRFVMRGADLVEVSDAPGRETR